VDFRSLLHKESGNGHPAKENQAPPITTPTVAAAPVEGVGIVCKQEEDTFCPGLSAGDEGSTVGAGAGAGGGGGRWDKSLGVLCQKFIMLFLVTPVSRITVGASKQQDCRVGFSWKPMGFMSKQIETWLAGLPFWLEK
jgi:hypothetical protein